MKLTDQVISLDTAKKMKDLGVKQDSYWVWTKIKDHTGLVSANTHLLNPYAVSSYSAFTVAELGVMMPDGATLRKKEIEAGFVVWIVYDKEYLTEAEARAEFLIKYIATVKNIIEEAQTDE